MGYFKHRELPDFDHPWLRFERSGRPTAMVLKVAVEAVSRPFVDFFQKELRRRLQPSLAECEYVFCNHILEMQGDDVKEHNLDVILNHDGPDRHISGPVAVIHLHTGRITWTNVGGSIVYREIAEKPEEFRVALEDAVYEMLCRNG